MAKKISKKPVTTQTATPSRTFSTIRQTQVTSFGLTGKKTAKKIRKK